MHGKLNEKKKILSSLESTRRSQGFCITYPLGTWFSSFITFASTTGQNREKNSANSLAVVYNKRIQEVEIRYVVHSNQ